MKFSQMTELKDPFKEMEAALHFKEDLVLCSKDTSFEKGRSWIKPEWAPDPRKKFVHLKTLILRDFKFDTCFHLKIQVGSVIFIVPVTPNITYELSRVIKVEETLKWEHPRRFEVCFANAEGKFVEVRSWEMHLIFRDS